MSYDLSMRVWRGDREGGELGDYTVSVETGEVVLDAIHRLQATQAGDLAVRWNCKAGKCGSCSAEVNGKPRLMCMTRMDQFPAGEPITIAPMKSFPVMKDLVCDVSWNYDVNRRMPAFRPRPPDKDGAWLMQLYVKPGWTGRGIGTNLLREALADAAFATPVLRLYTFSRNEGARRFYERHGFVAVAFGDGSGNQEGEPDVRYERSTRA